VMPTRFAAYIRIFHPPWRRDGGDQTEVRWSAVVTWSGRTVHAEMQFHSIAVPLPGRQAGPGPWSTEPRLGGPAGPSDQCVDRAPREAHFHSGPLLVLPLGRVRLSNWWSRGQVLLGRRARCDATATTATATAPKAEEEWSPAAGARLPAVHRCGCSRRRVG